MLHGLNIRLLAGALSAALLNFLNRTLLALLARRPAYAPTGLPPHGVRQGMPWRFLQAVRPQVAVISGGARNRFGRPGPATLKRLREVGTQVWRTDECGDVEVVTEGRSCGYGAEGPADTNATGLASLQPRVWLGCFLFPPGRMWMVLLGMGEDGARGYGKVTPLLDALGQTGGASSPVLSRRARPSGGTLASQFPLRQTAGGRVTTMTAARPYSPLG